MNKKLMVGLLLVILVSVTFASAECWECREIEEVWFDKIIIPHFTQLVQPLSAGGGVYFNASSGKWQSDRVYSGTVTPAAAAAPAAPVILNISGTWNTTFGNLTFNQTVPGAPWIGNYVYGGKPGTIVGDLGNIINNNLIGFWNDASGGGRFNFTFKADGKSFTGTWGTSLSSTDGGSWNGTKIS